MTLLKNKSVKLFTYLLRKSLILLAGGVPNGIRTRVAGVKGQCPRPLDDGDCDQERLN